MSSADDGGPQPTAHDYDHGCTLSRREAMQTSALALAALAGTGTVAADDGDLSDEWEGTCDSRLRFALPLSCGLADPDSHDEIDPDADRATFEIDAHIQADGIYEKWSNYAVTQRNYMQDTTTLASLDARHSIASDWEDGESVEQAQANSTMAIDDYFAAHQKQVLNEISMASAEIAYLVSASRQHDDVDDEFIHGWLARVRSDAYDNMEDSEMWIEDETVTREYDLVNGESYEYRTLLLDGQDENITIPMSHELLVDDEDDIEDEGSLHWSIASWDDDDYQDLGDGRMIHFGGIQILNQPDSDRESFTVYDYREPWQIVRDLQEQASYVRDNYPDGLAEDLYAAMDAGDLDPNQVRGAEGMIRHLSGDSGTADYALEVALRESLALESPDDLTVTMAVEFRGADERTRVVQDSDDGEPVIEYNYVEMEHEGVPFARETPEDGFEVGETYTINEVLDDDGEPIEEDEDGEPVEPDMEGTMAMIGAGGEEVVFYRGEITITGMWDGDGNEIEQTDWSGPEYESYDVDDYIAGLEAANERREEIAEGDDEEGEDGDDDDGDGWGLPSFGSDFGGSSFAGLAIIGVVVLAAVGFVTDLLPWT